MADDEKRIDASLKAAPDFARPLCEGPRKAVKRADPELVEVVKWGVPNFEKDGLVCAFAAFRRHVTFTFFKGSLLKDPKKRLDPRSDANVRNRSMKFEAGDAVDAKAVADFVRQAVALNRRGMKTPARRAGIPAPRDLKAALAGNRKADAFFASLSPACRREYVEWIVEAKRPETRAERIRKTVVQCAGGKTRHWKYR